MFRLFTPRSFTHRLVVTATIVLVTILTTFAAERLVPGESLVVLLAGAILCSLYAGFGFGMLAAIGLSLAQNFFFELPNKSFGVHSLQDEFELALFLAMSILVGFVGSALRKARLEAEAARKNALEASQAREDLLGIVSHDLRNPLASVQMSSELLRRRLELGDATLAPRLLETIRTSTDQMSRLIRDLLDYEKIRAGRLIVDTKPHSVRALLLEVERMLAPLAAEKGIKLIVEPPDESLFVSCDSARFIQVFSNLVGNALKFTPEAGKIRITTREEEKSVLFSVSDTGQGIPLDQLPRVFDRYWQAPRARRQGTGLGLSIVKGIIESHEGKVFVESQVGVGTTFSFTFPRVTTNFRTNKVSSL